MVQQVETDIDFSKISPNFIYNRIDLFSGSYIVLHVKNDYDYYLEVQLYENRAELGIWMMFVSSKDFEEIFQFIFSGH